MTLQVTWPQETLSLFLGKNKMGANLVVNGTMEADSNWSDVGTPVTNERSSVQKAAGSYSRKFTVDDAAQGIISDAFSTTLNKAYYLEFDVFSPDAVIISAAILEGDGGAGKQIDVAISIDTWTRITTKHIDVAGGASAQIKFISKTGITSGSWYIDNVSYVEEDALAADRGPAFSGIHIRV
jgi:hypothetical protein